MIVCKLGNILKRRGIKVSTLARDTGISRTTITSLVRGHSNGVQYDTLSSLCKYLNVSIDMIFEEIDTSNAISVEKLIRELIDNSHYANNKVIIKNFDGKEFGVYKFSTLENGDVEITIENKE